MKRLLAALAVALAVGVLAVPVAWDVVMRIALTPRCESAVLSEQKSPNEQFVFWALAQLRRDDGLCHRLIDPAQSTSSIQKRVTI
jgi:hypothetical protein